VFGTIVRAYTARACPASRRWTGAPVVTRHWAQYISTPINSSTNHQHRQQETQVASARAGDVLQSRKGQTRMRMTALSDFESCVRDGADAAD